MSEYAERFAGNDIEMAVLPDLTDQHLEDPWRLTRTPVENVARDPRSQRRFSCRNGACGTRGNGTASAEP
jgi:hypothetical protein